RRPHLFAPVLEAHTVGHENLEVEFRTAKPGPDRRDRPGNERQQLRIYRIRQHEAKPDAGVARVTWRERDFERDGGLHVPPYPMRRGASAPEGFTRRLTAKCRTRPLNQPKPE